MSIECLNDEKEMDMQVQVDPLAAAKERGRVRYGQLLQVRGGSVPGDEYARRTGLTAAAVEGLRIEGKILGVPDNLQDPTCWLYPVRQIGLQGMERVLTRLRGQQHSEVSQLIFFLGVSRRFGLMPVDMVRLGYVDDAIAEADSYFEHGAA